VETSEGSRRSRLTPDGDGAVDQYVRSISFQFPPSAANESMFSVGLVAGRVKEDPTQPNLCARIPAFDADYAQVKKLTMDMYR